MTDRSTYAVYNPYNKPLPELPVIYGFNNGGSPGFMMGCLLAQDGTALGSHICSNEGFMYYDLGIIEGHRKDRHETFREHYPDGYRMDFITHSAVLGHAGLMDAFNKHKLQNIKTSEEADEGRN